MQRRPTSHGARGAGEADAKTERALAKADAKTERALAKVDEKIEAKTARVAAKVDAKIEAKAAKLAQHAARGAAVLDRVAAHLDAVDLWTRSEPGARKARLGRSEIAAAGIHIADADGLDALSMRRLAADLDVGTMTLYHYVHTKDELLALMVDTFLAEVVLPAGVEPLAGWRESLSVIARRTRDAVRRHPWVLDLGGDPTIGPNAMRHIDQSWQALAGLDADLDTKLDLITAVDEYVLGYCRMEHSGFTEGGEETLAYMEELIAEGGYPALAALTAADGLSATWSRMRAHATDEQRFDRNLARLLAGFAAEQG